MTSSFPALPQSPLLPGLPGDRPRGKMLQPQPPVLSARMLSWPRTQTHWSFSVTPCHCTSTDLSLSDLLLVLRCLCVPSSLRPSVSSLCLVLLPLFLCPCLWDPGPAPVRPPPIFKIGRWRSRARPLSLWKNLLSTFPQPLATLLVPLLQRMKFDWQGKLRLKWGQGSGSPLRSTPFVA